MNLYEITFTTRVGEYEHFSTSFIAAQNYEDARAYASKELDTYWGEGETRISTIDDDKIAWSPFDERATRLYSVIEKTDIRAHSSGEGTKGYSGWVFSISTGEPDGFYKKESK